MRCEPEKRNHMNHADCRGLFFAAFFAAACSGESLDNESVDRRDESVTPVPIPTATATTVTSNSCRHDWIAEAPGSGCPPASSLSWSWTSVVFHDLPVNHGKQYCAYVAKSPFGGAGGPFPAAAETQAPTRSDCPYATRGDIPSAAPLVPNNCTAMYPCGHELSSPPTATLKCPTGSVGTAYAINECGGPPVYNKLSRMLTVTGTVFLVGLGSTQSNAVSVFSIPGPGIYQLSGVPADASYLQYRDADPGTKKLSL